MIETTNQIEFFLPLSIEKDHWRCKKIADPQKGTHWNHPVGVAHEFCRPKKSPRLVPFYLLMVIPCR